MSINHLVDIASPTIHSFKARRIALGLSQEKLAHLAGISLGSYALIEAGKRDPRDSTVRRIRAALAAAEAAA